MEFVNKSVEDLIEDSNQKELILPNFQREFIWDRNQNQKPLLTSILFGIPIGSLLILKARVDFVSSKELCFMEDSIDIQKQNKEVQFLLDGQQRISTLKSIFYDFFTPEAWKENYEKIYEKLKTRWFLKVIPDLSNENNDHEVKDIFGWKNLKFDENEIYKKYEPTDLNEIIEYQKIFSGKTGDWFHPEFKKEEWLVGNKVQEMTRKENIIAVEAARKGLVPLNEVCLDLNKTKKLHYIVLRKIANQRVKNLEDELMNDPGKKDELLRECPAEYDAEEALNNLALDWIEEVYSFIEGLKGNKIPVILLEQQEMNRAIYTFEFVNKGGTPLDVYDLVVAKAAHDTTLEETLTERIRKKLKNKINLPSALVKNLMEVEILEWSPQFMDIHKDGQLTDSVKNSFLNLLSIFSHCGFPGFCDEIKVENVKKGKQLELTTNQVNENTCAVSRPFRIKSG